MQSRKIEEYKNRIAELEAQVAKYKKKNKDLKRNMSHGGGDDGPRMKEYFDEVLKQMGK